MQQNTNRRQCTYIMPFQKELDALNSTELTWLTVQFNPLEDDCLDEFKSLRETCLEKLVSDVCLFRNLTGMPHFIHSMLLSTALAQNRVLSISQLMKYCPYKEIKLPVPASLKHWESLVKPKNLILCDMEKYMESAITMLTTFTCLIEEGCKTTQLEILDLGIFPWSGDVLNSLCQFILRKDPKKEKFSKTYTLKIAVSLTEVADANQLLNLMNAAEALGLDLLLIGIECHNCRFPEEVMLNIIQKLDPSEFVHFSLKYARTIPSLETLLINLQNFKNLKYLNFSYQAHDFSQEPLLSTLATTLNELPQLSRLILQGNKLYQCLNVVLQKFCKKNTVPVKESKIEDKCCIVHNRNLEYLDISAGTLVNEDILFLKEMPLACNLKYLNVHYNCLNGLSGFQTLLALKSSLVVLEMENAFNGYPLYDADLFPFSEFKQLRYLNMKGLDLQQSRNFPQFVTEKKKAPKLIIRTDPLDRPVQARFDFGNVALPPEHFFLLPDD